MKIALAVVCLLCSLTACGLEQRKSTFEAEFWREIRDSTEAAHFEEYLKRFPDGTFRTFAEERLRSLRLRRASGTPTLAEINGVEMWFMWIPPGEFVMGCSPEDGECSDDEKPRHRVRITKGFEMGKYEVTQAQWEAVMGSNPSVLKGANRPVTPSWREMQEFLGKLNARDDGYRYRLPTEAEWEYAARARETESGIQNPDAVGWHRGNSDRQLREVGQKEPNSFGLHDMQGNVLESVQDWYAGDYYGRSPPEDPQGPSSGSSRVQRGGRFTMPAQYLRLSDRTIGMADTDRIAPISEGFRCARERSR